jgi:non-specific serine/threonine protein kinase
MERMDGVREAGGTVFRWTFGAVEFNEAAWQLRIDGVAADIERRPLEVLAWLLRHAGEVVTKDELLEAAWPGRIVVEGVLTNAIGKLRKAIGDEEQNLIATVPRVGYRFIGKVERRVIERRAAGTQLAAGDAVPRRPNWRLLRALDQSGAGEVWLAEQAKTREPRVFKFSFDGSRLGALKREATISRLLHDSLGEREDFVRVIDWDFEDAPYFIESDYGGPDLEAWAESKGGLASIPFDQRVEWLAQMADALAPRMTSAFCTRI